MLFIKAELELRAYYGVCSTFGIKPEVIRIMDKIRAKYHISRSDMVIVNDRIFN